MAKPLYFGNTKLPGRTPGGFYPPLRKRTMAEYRHAAKLKKAAEAAKESATPIRNSFFDTRRVSPHCA